jgi:hypothetical protein
MPKIQQQIPTEKPQVEPLPSNEDNGGYVEQGMKILSYGRSKMGKTRLLATFPKPLLIVGLEDGTKSICTGRKPKKQISTKNTIYSLSVGGKPTGVDFIRVNNTQEIPELVQLLVQDKYKSVGLDTAGGLQDLIFKEILGLDSIPVQKSWGMADKRAWGVVGVQFKERMEGLLNLADTHGIHVMVIAHERNFKEEGDSEIATPTVGAALTPSAANWLNGKCDYICQAYIRQQTKKVTTEFNGKQVETTVPTGKVEYCLRVGPHDKFATGFRTPPGVVLPDSITNPEYAKILSVINGEYKP